MGTMIVSESVGSESAVMNGPRTSEQVPSVSVVLAMRNEEAFIEHCLQTLVDQDYPTDQVEILVVDGMSDDQSPEIVRAWNARYPRISLLHNNSRKTPCGFNIGIRASTGDLIAIVSAHCELERDYIRECVRCLEQTGADNVGGPMRPISETFWGQNIALATSAPFGIGNSQFHYSQKEQFVDTVYMGMYRRERLEQIGLFDETLVRNQDYELNYRLRAAGGRIFYTPAIKSWYHGRSTLRDLWRQYLQYGFWKARVIRLHPGSTRPRHMAAPALVLGCMGAVALTLLYRPAAYLLVLILLVYALASAASTLALAARHGWRFLWSLPITFACIHVSWGLGFWWSWLRWLLNGRRELTPLLPPPRLERRQA
jgi:succinoglycan biosynthesis protein ExoA